MNAHIRRAVEADLPAMMRVWMASEGETTLQPDTQVPVGLAHVLSTGLAYVAGHGEEVNGFATSFVRGDVTFLAQLFVLPGEQSRGIGQALLNAVMPDGTQRATVSSPDPRAVSLYVRHGMVPVWPVFDLVGDVASLRDLPDALATIVNAAPEDPEIVAMDARAGGRPRPVDHRHWARQRGGKPFTIERRGRRVGYGYVQVGKDGDDAALRGDSVRVGPVGVNDPSAAYDSVLAAVALAREHGRRLEILMPGIHPALGALLEAGFQIRDIETFMCSSRPPFVDGASYVPSGGGLF